MNPKTVDYLSDNFATPIARTLGLPCVDPATKQLRPDSPCARTKANLKSGMNLAEAFYDGYFRKPQPKE